jgi:uncharacterized membrane-anchored protein
MQNKVPEVTLAFWVIKICATTLGETFGDFLSMTLGLGYAASTALLFVVFVITLAAQIVSRSFHPFVYWSVILSTTTVGTTISDYLDRTAGLGYVVGSALLGIVLICVLTMWRSTTGSISVSTITNAKVEVFYWTAILVSNTLGTALGDFMADSSGLGFGGAALVFAGLLTLIALAYFLTGISRTALFWFAFVLTRPLGATLGDVLTKPMDHGGLNLGRLESSLVITDVSCRHHSPHIATSGTIHETRMIVRFTDKRKTRGGIMVFGGIGVSFDEGDGTLARFVGGARIDPWTSMKFSRSRSPRATSSGRI